MTNWVTTGVKILIFLAITVGVCYGLSAVTGGKTGALTNSMPLINVHGVMSPINTSTGYSLNMTIDNNTGIPITAN